MNSNRLKPLFSVLLIFIAAPLLAALTAPWVYMAIQSRAAEVLQWVQESEAAGTHLFWADLANSVFDSPFRRVNDRLVLIFVLALLAPAYRMSGLRGRADFGIPKRSDGFRLFGAGLLVAVASMLLVYLIGLFAGVYRLEPMGQGVAAALLKIVIGTLLIGVIEEILFRGYILTALRKSLGAVPAVLLSSALFAAVHFIKPAEPEFTDRWYSGFLLFADLFAKPGDTFWPEVCTLFCMGTVLATLSYWTRSVYIAIGLHAGWVWIMMLFRLFAENQGRLVWLYGPGEWISKGWVGPIMALAVWAVVFATRKKWIAMGNEA
ncbi:MAG: CPBP family intramembrane metalloprotease [Kiritimatiellales bacterium]|nr:CPBP family intramembrane metalloprotease [Kiritimatiellota bacterium]MBL7011597.1 CPBP family intramembrane metalloprotease [Kiritimatiellales bacterium]